ncbi:MAG: glucosaminidase domain-containing protein [Sphingobacteriales bacterium]|jgi:LysM repeat protein|nr:glucosaminidase domain-containing protein [Sphingobacteriales bacterium]
MIKKLTANILLLLITVISYGQKAEVIENYIKTYRTIAIEEMQRTGVPAAIKLAQGIHETMAGQSELVLKSNNHFGIKCKEGYNGPYVLHDDDRPKERFMMYEDAMQSYKDHSDFLKNRSRYASLFQLDPTDFRGWAMGLKRAGYATNPKYPQLLIGLIEKYNLQEYTMIGLGQTQMPDEIKEHLAVQKQTIEPEIVPEPAPIYPTGEFKINNTRVIFVKKGTALPEIASQFNMTKNRLFDFNDFPFTSDIAPKDMLVFLQPKRTMGENIFHEVKPGENIYDIAQSEGIRLESLLKYNNLSKFTLPAIGSKLSLQETNNFNITGFN